VLSREREVDGECVDEVGRDAHHVSDDAEPVMAVTIRGTIQWMDFYVD
jgi:hypothetical protein